MPSSEYSPSVRRPADQVEGQARPVRIQRKRTRGFNLQAQSPDGRPVVSVCRPGKWGNEFAIYEKNGEYFVRDSGGNQWGHNYQSRHAAQAKAVRLYANGWLEGQVGGGKLDLAELRGKHLACFCSPGSPCHADVLLRFANADPMPTKDNPEFFWSTPPLPSKEEAS